MYQSYSKTVLQKISIVFILSFLALILLNCSISNASTPKSYTDAKNELTKLYKDDKRSMWREPWQSLAEKFYKVYTDNKKWNNKAAALFNSALCLDELAKRSMTKLDAKNAVERYKLVVKNHKISVLADDALYNMAILQAEYLDENKSALNSLNTILRSYKKGDYYNKANERAKHLRPILQVADIPEIKDAEVKVKPSNSLITNASWKDDGKIARVYLDLDKNAAWELRSMKLKSGYRLVLDLHNTKPGAKVSSGDKLKKGDLQTVRIDYSKLGNTRIILDFKKLERFSLDDRGNKLTIMATGQRKYLVGGAGVGTILRSPDAAAAERRNEALKNFETEKDSVRNIASQFGLNIKTVVIDAGHGGKDPGAIHNKIVEKEINLDVALRLGKILKNQGYNVKYTRTTNAWVSLDDRVNLASKYHGDVFISLHINASTNKNKTGIETYYLGTSSSVATANLASIENMLSTRKLGELEALISELTKNALKDESKRLADDIQRSMYGSLKKSYKVKNGGVHGAPFVVLMNSKMPSVLVEMGYCSNATEAKRLASSKYREILANAIAEGLISYSDRLQNVKTLQKKK